jgi:hypothetical protein
MTQQNAALVEQSAAAADSLEAQAAALVGRDRAVQAGSRRARAPILFSLTQTDLLDPLPPFGPSLSKPSRLLI